MHATLPLLAQTDFPALSRRHLSTLQVNVGYKCNQSCVHCHVNAGPQRTELMSRETTADVLTFLSLSSIRILDVTGGAPAAIPVSSTSPSSRSRPVGPSLRMLRYGHPRARPGGRPGAPGDARTGSAASPGRSSYTAT